MDLGLADAAVLVTAGSSGLGKASAEAVAREGADVAICARNAERLESARESINAAGDGAVLAIQADITDDQGDIANLIGDTVDAFDGLDHLIVSSGGPRTGAFLETVDRDWYVAYDLLVMSIVRLGKEALPYLAEGERGSITVIGSIATRQAVEGLVLSSAVRRAAVGLVETMARELAPTVRANAVLPGPHQTPYLESVADAFVEQGRCRSRAEAVEVMRETIPLGRVGDPAEFGDVVAFLASERARYVTGAAVPIDGGAVRG